MLVLVILILVVLFHITLYFILPGTTGFVFLWFGFLKVFNVSHHGCLIKIQNCAGWNTLKNIFIKIGVENNLFKTSYLEFIFFFNKFLNLQTQLLNSKEHRNCLQETIKKQNKPKKEKSLVQRQHAYEHVHTVLLVKNHPPTPLLLLFPLNSLYNKNNNNNVDNNNNRPS